MYTIATLDQLRRDLGLEPGADDSRLLASLQAASAQLERLANRHFCPYLATRRQFAGPRQGSELILDDDLLELHTLITDHGEVPLEAVRRLPDNGGPASILVLSGGHTFTTTDEPPTVAVTGIWGWHDQWMFAWRDTLAATGIISAVDTLLPVETAGSDAVGEVPRFQVGHLLKVDDEYMRVLDVQAEGLIVLRGVDRTAATAHAAETPVFTYQPPPDVVMLAVRWAAWLYRGADYPAQDATPLALMHALGSFTRPDAR